MKKIVYYSKENKNCPVVVVDAVKFVEDTHFDSVGVTYLPQRAQEEAFVSCCVTYPPEMKKIIVGELYKNNGDFIFVDVDENRSDIEQRISDSRIACFGVKVEDSTINPIWKGINRSYSDNDFSM